MKILIDSKLLIESFSRCCEEYHSLHIYSAWVGNPSNIVPFDFLKQLKEIKATVGVSFFHSNPDGLRFLRDLNKGMRIAKDDNLFHPKVYIFTKENKKALIIGSSNFTYSGFYENEEANILIEGDEYRDVIIQYEKALSKWDSDDYSFRISDKWLKDYEKQYIKRKVAFKKARIKNEAVLEDNHVFSSSWLDKADWGLYLKHIKAGIKQHEKLYGEGFEEKFNMLQESKSKLSLPWSIDYFDSIENRRIITGLPGYGWLGHIAASGHVRHLFANGTKREKQIIVSAINEIGSIKHPIDYTILNNQLKKLVKLGPTMKVWGRLLALVRPDLFCTVSSPSVRENLSEKLSKPKTYFETIEGYIHLQKLIHASPWFNSPKPNDGEEKQIWENRVAFLDVDFY